LPDLVAVRLPDAPSTATAVARVWGAGDAVTVLDPAMPDAAAADLLARLRPGALVHTRPDGSGPKVTRLRDAVATGTAAVVTTSGSTGEPRAVVLSRTAMDASADATIARLGCRPGDVWLGCLPLHHVAGLAVLRRAARLGAPADVHDGFDVTAVAASPARWWPVVPTMLARLVDAGTDLARRGVLLGGAPPDPAVVAAAERRGARVVVSYGMTETCGGCVYDGVPLDGVEVAVDARDGRIRLRGPVLADGERGPDGHVTSLVDGDGWLVTDDVGALADGRLEVRGRADHVILTGGENVAPEAVERALEAHPEVLAAGGLGQPHPEWGQRVVAVVVPRDPTAPPRLAELRDHVSATLGRHAAPRDLHVVDRVPTTSLGKVARGALAALVAERGG
jgi:O-succinylbenzoic acid--CoA ligase